MSAPEAHALIEHEGYVYVDVRSQAELDTGHPAGAFQVPLSLPTAHGAIDNPDFVRVMQARFAPHSKLVIGCATGVRSLRAAQLLIDAGYTHVVDQRAGFSGVKDAFGRTLEPGWSASGLPVAYEPLPGRDYLALASQLKKAT